MTRRSSETERTEHWALRRARVSCAWGAEVDPNEATPERLTRPDTC